MSLEVYQDRILEPVIRLQLAEAQLNGTSFTLEEDSNLGYSTGKLNICRIWKKEHDLDYYFNVSGSLDLAPIENCWQGPK